MSSATDVPSRNLVIAGVPVRCVSERAEAEREVALEIADLVRGKPAAVLGLASGSSVLGVYRELVLLHRRGEIDFSRVTTFNLDEYLGLPESHPASFRRWMHDHFFDQVNVDPRNTHLPSSAVRPAEAPRHADEYERKIADAGGLDLQLLGVGRNGHIGFNEPGSARDSRTRVVELHATTVADAAASFGAVERVPASAITIGVATILDARAIRVLAFGSHKSTAVQRMFREAIGPATPATHLRLHANVVVWLDAPAAYGLENDPSACGSSPA